MRYAIVNLDLKVKIPKKYKTEEQIQEYIENIKLPHNYKEDSFEFCSVVEE